MLFHGVTNIENPLLIYDFWHRSFRGNQWLFWRKGKTRQRSPNGKNRNRHLL